MNDTKNGQPEDGELSAAEALLPWYATGRLSAEEQVQVESALAEDGELRRRLALVRDEAADTIAVNERIAPPRRLAFDQLMGKIDAFEAEHPRRVSLADRATGWLSQFMGSLSPKTLAWSATAAAAVICIEGAMLTGMLAGGAGHQTQHFTTASYETKLDDGGTYALISFVGAVPLQDVTDFLQNQHATLQEGPKPGGFYRVKISDAVLSGEALNAKLAALRGKSNIVAIVLPEAARQ